MSWSINVAGTSEEVERAIDQTINTYGQPGPSNYSRTEFETVRPYLVGLVQQATGKIRLTASGHKSFNGTVITYGDISVEIKREA